MVVLVPNHDGTSSTPPTPPPAPTFGGSGSTNPFGPPPTAATRRAQARAEHAVRPLAQQFIVDLIGRRRLAAAYALLDTRLRRESSLVTWRAGHLPLAVPETAEYGGLDIAYSGSSLVGLVATISPNDGNPDADSILFAMRFVRAGRAWRIDYLHQGHSSTYVDAGNYAPHGFLPGSSPGSTSSWLLLVLGFLGVVTVVALLDYTLARPRRRRQPV